MQNKQIQKMEQQQKRKVRISEILSDNREITLEQLLFAYCNEKIPLQEIRKYLTSIQEEQNSPDDIAYQLRLTGKRVLALNAELVLDVVTKFDLIRQNPKQFTPKIIDQLNELDSNHQMLTQDYIAPQQEQFREEYSSKSHPHSQPSNQPQLQPSYIRPNSQKSTQKPQQLPNNSSHKPLPQSQNQSKNQFNNEFENQFETQLEPAIQNQQAQQSPTKQQKIKSSLKSPQNQNDKILSPQKSQQKSMEKNQSTKSKKLHLQKSLSSHSKKQQIPQNKSPITGLQNVANPQANVNLRIGNEIKQKVKNQFQVNQFSVLDQKRNIQRQKRLQRRKQLQIQKQRKQKQRLANLLKRKMNSQTNQPQKYLNGLHPTGINHQQQSSLELKNALKQEYKHWKQKEPGEKNPYFDHLEGNQFDEDPQAIHNFLNEQELQELSDDLRNHQNLFDERGFVIANNSSNNHKKLPSFFSKQYQTLKNQLNRYLIPAYYQYVLQTYTTDVIFDKDQIFKKPLMDLTLFLKFYKDFDLKEFLKVPDVTKIFKKTAVNHLWIDTDKFIFICYKVIETKSNDNGKDPIHINTKEEIIQRTNQFINSFNKQKIKHFLKIHNKDASDQILNEYKNRKVNRTVEKPHKNKVQVVDKFLQRNFDLQIPKWKGKKDLNNKLPNEKSTIQSKVKLNHPKKPRDQKSISTDIQKLRSQSQKSLNVLKSLFNDKFDEQLRSLVHNKSQTRQSHESILSSQKNIGHKAPLHKNKHKNTISAYKQIEQFINQNINVMKTQKTLLSRNLKINEDQPFLNAYFSRQMKTSKQKNDGKIQAIPQLKLSPSNQKLSSARPPQNVKIPSNNPSPIKKYSVQNSSRRNLQPNNRNEFISLERLDKIRKNNSNSSPSDPKKMLISPNRANSMKKIGLNEKVDSKMSPSESSVVSLPSVRKIGGSRVKLNELENELINKKLYDFLLNNKEHQNNILAQKYGKIKKGNNKESIKTEGHQNLLMQNYRQEVYELFKNFVKRGQEQESIVAYENQKRKGYLKASKTPDNSQSNK